MPRTTPAEVRALLTGQDIEIDGVDIGRFITTANLFVTEQLGEAGLADALLTEIEKYLAAHFVSLREVIAGISSQRSDDASVTYTVGQVTSTEFLQSTHFGQVAIALDISGSLANAGKTNPALIAL